MEAGGEELDGRKRRLRAAWQRRFDHCSHPPHRNVRRRDGSPNGTAIGPTGKAFDVEFGHTTEWDGDRLIIISAFWYAVVQAKQIGLAG
jgi:hypothetical protein